MFRSAHRCFTNICVLMLNVLIWIMDAQLDVHGTIRLYAHSFRYSLPWSVCSNQPTLEIKDIYHSGHFPSWLWYSLEIFLSTWSSMAPGLSPDAVCMLFPLKNVLGHQLPRCFLWSSRWPKHTIVYAVFTSVCHTQISSPTWGKLFQQLTVSPSWLWKCF